MHIDLLLSEAGEGEGEGLVRDEIFRVFEMRNDAVLGANKVGVAFEALLRSANKSNRIVMLTYDWTCFS